MTAHCLIGLSTQFHACMGSRPFPTAGLPTRAQMRVGSEPDRRLWRMQGGRSVCSGRLWPSICAGHAGHRKRKQVDLPVPSIEKLHPFEWSSLCPHYLFLRLGQLLSCRPQQSGGLLQAEKTPLFRVELLMSALPIFTASHPAFIVTPKVTLWMNGMLRFLTASSHQRRS